MCRDTAERGKAKRKKAISYSGQSKSQKGSGFFGFFFEKNVDVIVSSFSFSFVSFVSFFPLVLIKKKEREG